MQSQIRKQGVPLSVKESCSSYNPSSQVFHAPKMLVSQAPLPRRKQQRRQHSGLWSCIVPAVVVLACGSQGLCGGSKASRCGTVRTRHSRESVCGVGVPHLPPVAGGSWRSH